MTAIPKYLFQQGCMVKILIPMMGYPRGSVFTLQVPAEGDPFVIIPPHPSWKYRKVKALSLQELLQKDRFSIHDPEGFLINQPLS